ncbi:MAG: permease prefix domain 1-containing protein [Terracidiphilus sp.]
MAKPFHELRERLLRAGVAPRQVRRYLTELGEHLADLRAEEERAGRSPAEAESAALVRLGSMDDLAGAMIDRRQFQSWCVRAPWAVFGLAPLFCLAGAWTVALSILASGWMIFLPQAETPFNAPIRGLAIFYFGVGKLIYFSAPVLVGWGIGLMAARHRTRAIWPLAGLTLIAWFGGTAQVHANRNITSSAINHVNMAFYSAISHSAASHSGTLAPGMSGSLIHVGAILLVTALPYLFWRAQRAFFAAG